MSEVNLDGLTGAVDEICAVVDKLRSERNEAREALRDLLDASCKMPTASRDNLDKLNAAQVKAAAVLQKVSGPEVTAAKG